MSRGFRRGFRRGSGARRLRRGHQLLEQGSFSEAAQVFEELAFDTEQRGARHAPMLFMQAGRALIQAGEAAQGLIQLKKGLEMLAERGKWARFQRAGQRASAELRQGGWDAEARELTGFLEERLPEGFDLAMAPGLTRRPLLPAHCPSCGAIVEPDEVEWTDEKTAECDYCGSPIRAQEEG